MNVVFSITVFNRESCSFYLEAGAVAGPGALVAGVEEAVAQQDKVACAARPLTRDLVQLALLDQLPARPDQLPVAQPRLQPQHPLELVLERKEDFFKCRRFCPVFRIIRWNLSWGTKIFTNVGFNPVSQQLLPLCSRSSDGICSRGKEDF
jgi:hypothetical protein